jgi:hypothetical protein
VEVGDGVDVAVGAVVSTIVGVEVGDGVEVAVGAVVGAMVGVEVGAGVGVVVGLVVGAVVGRQATSTRLTRVSTKGSIDLLLLCFILDSLLDLADDARAKLF